LKGKITNWRHLKCIGSSLACPTVPRYQCFSDCCCSLAVCKTTTTVQWPKSYHAKTERGSGKTELLAATKIVVEK